MPSGITHIFLTKKLQDELEDGVLKNILADGSDFMTIGAVGPDLPYASIADGDFFFTNQSSLADNFHYKFTNQIPLRAFATLKEMKGKSDKNLHRKMFTFFMGYTSHIFADGIIHPFVRDKVGDYAKNKSAHRSLEMQLDVLLVEEFTKKSGLSLEFNYTEIHNELLDFASYKESVETIKMFQRLIKEVYPSENHSTKTITGWIKGLHRLFAVAEGEHPKIYRNLEANTFLYKNRKDIEPQKVLFLNKPCDRNSNFINAPQIQFFNDIIPQYFRKYKQFANKCYQYVYEDGPALTNRDIPLINLDTEIGRASCRERV